MNQTCALFPVVSRLRHYDAAAPRSRRRLKARHTRCDDLIGGFATHFAQLLKRFGKSLFGRFTVTLHSLGECFGFNLEIDRVIICASPKKRTSRVSSRTPSTVIGVSMRMVPTRRSEMTSSRTSAVGSIFASMPCSSDCMSSAISAPNIKKSTPLSANSEGDAVHGKSHSLAVSDKPSPGNASA